MIGGIRRKVLLVALVPAAAISLLLGFYFVSAQLADIEKHLEERGLAIARHLATGSEYAVFSGNYEILQRLAAVTQKETDVRSVSITDVGGKILAKSGPDFLPHDKPEHLAHNVAVIPSKDGRSVSFRAPVLQSEIEVSDFPEMDMGVPTGMPSRNLDVMGWVNVELSYEATRKHQMETIVQSSAIAFIGLLFSLLVALKMGQSVSEPIVSLTDTVEQLGHGNLSARANTHAEGELLTLEKGVNSMASALQTAQSNLQNEIDLATSKLRNTLAELENKNDELDIERHKAQEANESKSQFLANMSHELRTPLNAIIGYSEMLEEEAEQAGHDMYIPDVQKVNSAGKHLLSLINDILDLSKVEAGKMNLYLETAEISSIIMYTASTIRPLAAQNHVDLVIDCPDDIGSMRMDVTKVRQVLFNLLSNACKFTENGTVTLSVSRIKVSGADWIEFKVSDTGIGMNTEQMQRLFEAFSQADDSISKRYGGTGLGLIICKRFSELMGGEIFAESKPGAGSTFTLQLPEEPPAPIAVSGLSAQDDATGTVPAPKEVRLDAVPAEGINQRSTISKILIIDDDTLVHDMLRRMLMKEGFEVYTSTNGKEGIERAKELKPNAIILDVLMPGMDGWTVLAKIKSDNSISSIPVIMLSMVDDRTRGYAMGVTEYLTKPADKTQLLATIKRAVREGPDAPILVVDDDQAQREILRRNLENEGWEVTVEHNGRSAMESVRARRPAAIILDLLMPEMDGMEFISELRAQPAFRDIPVAVLTSKDITPADRERLNGQVQKILKKGISRKEILDIVREFILSSST